MRRFWQALVVSVALGVGALWLALPDSFDLASLTTFTQLGFGNLALVFGLVGAWWLFGSLRNIYLAQLADTRLTLWQGFQTYLMGMVASVVTPSGGGNAVGIVWILTRFGIPIRQGVVMSVLTLVFDMSFFSWGVAVSSLYLLQRGVVIPVAHFGTLVLGFSAFLLVLCGVLIFRLRWFIYGLRRVARLRWLQRFEGKLEALLDSLELASRDLAGATWYRHLWFHSLSTALWVARFSLLAVIVVAFNLPTPFGEVMALGTVVHTFAFAIPTPGASGYQELALSWLLKAPGYQQSLASAIVFWRLLSYYLFFLIGPLLGAMALVKSDRLGAVTKGS